MVNLSKTFGPLLVLLAICFFALPAQAQYGGGTGGPNDPYQIYTAEQMNAIGANANDWDKHFKLMADIDLSSFTGADFSFFLAHWLDSNCDLSNNYCEGTDLNKSGTVDNDDLEIFLANWQAGGDN